jgi:hypothetical protein
MTRDEAIDLASRAIAAGEAAGNEDQEKYGDRGACGMARVDIADARTPFARHIRKAGLGGLNMSLRGNPQTLISWEKAANACQAVLAAAGVKAYARSWMD